MELKLAKIFSTQISNLGIPDVTSNENQVTTTTPLRIGKKAYLVQANIRYVHHNNTWRIAVYKTGTNNLVHLDVHDFWIQHLADNENLNKAAEYFCTLYRQLEVLLKDHEQLNQLLSSHAPLPKNISISAQKEKQYNVNLRSLTQQQLVKLIVFTKTL